MGAEKVKTDYSLFGINPKGGHVCLAQTESLEDIHSHYTNWVETVLSGQQDYVSLEIRRTQRAVIRKSAFVVTVKEE